MMMDEIRALLHEPLDTESGNRLAIQLSQAEALGARLSVMYREAENELTRQKGVVFDPSLKTELQRKVQMEYQTRNQQQRVDELGDLADLLKRRISLGQSMLKRDELEIKGGLR